MFIVQAWSDNKITALLIIFKKPYLKKKKSFTQALLVAKESRWELWLSRSHTKICCGFVFFIKCVIRKVRVRSGAEVNSKSFFFYPYLSALLHGP